MRSPDEINMNEENAFLLREAAKSASAGYYDHLSAGGKGDPAEERWIEALIAGADALAYIQQLEADNAQLNRCIENMTDKLNAAHDETVELKRELNAAMNDLSNCDGNCHFCDWFGDTGCVALDDGIRPNHTHDCPFKWRGVKEDT